MKKTLLLIPAVLLLFTAGCGQNSQSSSKSGSVRTTQSSKKTAKASTSQKQKKTASKSSSSTSSSTTESADAASSSTTNTSGTANVDQRYAALKQATFRQLGNPKWPSAYQVDQTQYLNIFTTGDSQNYSIFFSPGSHALAYNDATLQNVNAELAIQKKTYGNNAQAQAQIGAAQSTQGLPQVAIGDGIYAASQGAAGSSYLTWNEGRWTVTVKASAVNGEDPLPLAKEAVTWFANNALPAPETYGTVDLAVTAANTRQNQITWTEGNAVYQISGLDPMKTIQEGTATR